MELLLSRDLCNPRDTPVSLFTGFEDDYFWITHSYVYIKDMKTGEIIKKYDRWYDNILIEMNACDLKDIKIIKYLDGALIIFTVNNFNVTYLKFIFVNRKGVVVFENSLVSDFSYNSMISNNFFYVGNMLYYIHKNCTDILRFNIDMQPSGKYRITELSSIDLDKEVPAHSYMLGWQYMEMITHNTSDDKENIVYYTWKTDSDLTPTLITEIIIKSVNIITTQVTILHHLKLDKPLNAGKLLLNYHRTSKVFVCKLGYLSDHDDPYSVFEICGDVAKFVKLINIPKNVTSQYYVCNKDIYFNTDGTKIYLNSGENLYEYNTKKFKRKFLCSLELEDKSDVFIIMGSNVLHRTFIATENARDVVHAFRL